jgi:hypothetical protein
MISPRQRFGILLPDLAKLTLDLSTLSANDVCIGNRKKRSILKKLLCCALAVLLAGCSPIGIRGSTLSTAGSSTITGW